MVLVPRVPFPFDPGKGPLKRVVTKDYIVYYRLWSETEIVNILTL